MKKKILVLLLAFCMIIGFGIACEGRTDVLAATAVTVSNIDYEGLTLRVNKNGNSIIYYSVDNQKTWNEVDGAVIDGYVTMDISWASASSEVTFYLKGDACTTVLDVTLPKQSTSFKAVFDKSEGTFTFSGQDDATGFYWRKSTDYSWNYVDSFDIGSASYTAFLSKIDELRFKGAKICMMTGQVMGTDADNMGSRPSKTITVSITKRSNAPSIKVNVKKMTISTKTNQEYYDGTAKRWISCEKNMSIAELAPDSLYANSDNPKATVLKIRTAATSSKPYSQTCMITIPAQTAAPTIGKDSGNVRYAFKDGKLLLTFKDASKNVPVDYCIIKPGTDFNEATAKWKTVKSAGKVMKINSKTCPDGSEIYVRYTGIAENINKGIALKLPSAYSSVTINWPDEQA